MKQLVDMLAEAAKNDNVRPLYEIADEIRKCWKPRVSPYAQPYLDAMSELESINDKYYMDSAKSIVAYFLSNAASFKGDDAKRLKAELKSMLK